MDAEAPALACWRSPADGGRDGGELSGADRRLKWNGGRQEYERHFCQYTFSLRCDYDNGVPGNDAEAVKWCRLASDQGDTGVSSLASPSSTSYFSLYSTSLSLWRLCDSVNTP